jgi:hypothetical protein
MTRAFDALEASLRAGPDESGFAAGPFDVNARVREEPEPSFMTIERVGRVELRRPGRAASLSFSVVSALALALAIAVGGFVILGDVNRSGPGVRQTPASSPSASGSAVLIPALTETFVSIRNGFSVDYPAGWSVRPATKSWPADIFLPLGNPAYDELQRRGEAALNVASQRLAAGQTEADWLASFFHPYQGPDPCGTAPADSPRLQIDGHSGYLVDVGCPMPADRTFSVPDLQYRAIVIADGRVYDIRLDGNVDRAYFDAIVATIRLDPSSAVDP